MAVAGQWPQSGVAMDVEFGWIRVTSEDRGLDNYH